MTNNMAGAPMWDERFSGDDYLFGTEPAAFLVDQADALALNSKVLVIADGEGRNSVHLARQGHAVTTMDISPVGAEKARQLAATHGVEVDITVADILDWEWTPAAYDAVVGIFFQFLGPEQRNQVFEGMQQTVRPGGRVLVHGYRPEQVDYGTGGPPVRDNMYTEQLLSEAFADLEIERLESYDAEIDEGSGHVGMSALIDLIATKPA